MEAIKSAINSVLHPSSHSGEQAPHHDGQTPAQQVKEEQQLSEATRDLSLEDKNTRECFLEPQEVTANLSSNKRVKKARAQEARLRALEEALLPSRDMYALLGTIRATGLVESEPELTSSNSLILAPTWSGRVTSLRSDYQRSR